MFNIYRCEITKLKHTKLYWAVWLPAIISNLASLMVLLPDMSGEAANTYLREMFYQQGTILTIINPFIFALITGYIISREYSERTINQLFTYPVSRERIFTAKLCAIYTLILFVSALSCITVFVFGTIEVLMGAASFSIFIKGMWMNLLACLLSFGTIPLAAALSMIGKSVIPPMVLGALASLANILEIGTSMKAVLFPWATPYLTVREFGKGFADTGPNPYATTAVTILSVLLLISLAFCLIYYRKSEVHSGS